MTAIACCARKALIRNAVHTRADPPVLFDVQLTPQETQRVHGFFVHARASMVLGPGASRGAALWHDGDAPGGLQRCTLVHNNAGHTYTAYATSYAPGETQVYVLSFTDDAVAWRPLGSLQQPVPLSWSVHGIINHFELTGVPPACASAARAFAATPWALMHDTAVVQPAALSARLPDVELNAPLLCVPRAGAPPTLVTPAAAQRGVWTLVFAGGMALAAPSIEDAAETPDGTWYAHVRTTLPLQTLHAPPRAGELHDERVAKELGAHGAAALHDAQPAHLVLRPARNGKIGWELLCVNHSTEHPWVLTHRDKSNGHGALVAWESTMHDKPTLARVLSRAAPVVPMHRRKLHDAHGVRSGDGTVQLLALHTPLPGSYTHGVAHTRSIAAATAAQWHSITEYHAEDGVFVHGDAFLLAAATHAHGAAFTQFPRFDTTHASGAIVAAHSKQIDLLTPRASCVFHAHSALPYTTAPGNALLHAHGDAAPSTYVYDGAGRAL